MKITIIIMFQYYNVPQVTREYLQEDMFVEIVDITSITSLPANRTISICGYVQKVLVNIFRNI